jgi:hypothetical protein
MATQCYQYQILHTHLLIEDLAVIYLHLITATFDCLHKCIISEDPSDMSIIEVGFISKAW